jgi:hypothetical protein
MQQGAPGYKGDTSKENTMPKRRRLPSRMELDFYPKTPPQRSRSYSSSPLATTTSPLARRFTRCCAFRRMPKHPLSQRTPLACRPTSRQRDRQHRCILHRRGHRHHCRGPCRYQRTAAIANHSPSPNDDPCRPPRATTSCMGTARPARP